MSDLVQRLSEGTHPVEVGLRDGKTTRVEIHTDTALMERIYGTKQRAAH